MQGGAACAVGAAAGGLDDRGPVLGARDGGEAAGGRHMEGAAAFEPLLGPVEDRLDAPARAGAAGAHLALPAVERALFRGGSDPGADLVARVVRPQPPGAGLVGVPHGGGQLGRALLGGRETAEHGYGEGAESRVVVAQGEFVEGPGPVGAGRGVPPQQGQGVAASVRGEVAEHGEGEPGARVFGVEVVVGIAQVPFDLFDAAVEVEIEARVVEERFSTCQS